MALNGSSCHFVDGTDDIKAENLNSLEMGGNMYKSPSGGLSLVITAIAGAIINGVYCTYAGETVTLANNALTYCWLVASGSNMVFTTSASAFPAYPGTKHIRLGIVSATGGVIDAIYDRRPKFTA